MGQKAESLWPSFIWPFIHFLLCLKLPNQYASGHYFFVDLSLARACTPIYWPFMHSLHHDICSLCMLCDSRLNSQYYFLSIWSLNFQYSFLPIWFFNLSILPSFNMIFNLSIFISSYICSLCMFVTLNVTLSISLYNFQYCFTFFMIFIFQYYFLSIWSLNFQYSFLPIFRSFCILWLLNSF